MHVLGGTRIFVLALASVTLMACAPCEKSQYARHLQGRVMPSWTAPAIAAHNTEAYPGSREAALGAFSSDEPVDPLPPPMLHLTLP